MARLLDSAGGKTQLNAFLNPSGFKGGSIQDKVWLKYAAWKHYNQ